MELHHSHDRAKASRCVVIDGFFYFDQDGYDRMAERVGFEPTVPGLAEHTISSRAPSANSGISPHYQTKVCLTTEITKNKSSQILYFVSKPWKMKIQIIAVQFQIISNTLFFLSEVSVPLVVCHLIALIRPLKLIGGEGGIRTHVPGYSPDKSISSRPRYDHFGTSPRKSLT